MVFSNFRLRSSSPWLSIWWIYAGAILVCVGLPYIVMVLLNRTVSQAEELTNSAIAGAVAVTFGAWLYRNVTSLPGVRSHAGILPSFALSFATVALVILLWRIGYSRSLFFICMFLTMIWHYIFYFVAQKRIRLTIGIVEGGRAAELEGNVRYDVRRLSLEEDPIDCHVIAADLRFDHSPAWEARLADYVLKGYPVYHCKDLLESLSGRTDLEHMSENTFGKLGPIPAFQVIKSIVDRLMALPAFIILFPFLVIIGVAIRLDSAGPALFWQRRIGYRGKEFEVVKFRTMRVRNHDVVFDERRDLITQEDDERITKLGRFLRRSRIDELPQIYNILAGQMSWIGPRPEVRALSEWYEKELPFYRYRHVVVPGITGWAQVNQGHVAEIEQVREKLQFDFYYIRNFSFWLDLLIILRTIRTMLTGFGSR
ncbi:sugar transferase [Altererythrobacter sp. Root672]|uniref:sugar transferase n=1 Tax=Altererythrobacter sp. Root672 TaxID=1736584 RepID=UPI0006F209AE|nr:sugar transferase [Altererythrobacter sp. Root672]KRA83185.1 hypothetical protein ASD76_03705 [Altererythrobacter sp. Root672]